MAEEQSEVPIAATDELQPTTEIAEENATSIAEDTENKAVSVAEEPEEKTSDDPQQTESGNENTQPAEIAAPEEAEAGETGEATNEEQTTKNTGNDGDASADKQEEAEKVTEDGVKDEVKDGEEKDDNAEDGVKDGEEKDGNTEDGVVEPTAEEGNTEVIRKDSAQPDELQMTNDGEQLPESSTFTDGERPETPIVAVIDPLSREGSPVQEPETFPPGTPEREASPLIEYEEYDEEGYEEKMMSREELIECYQAAIVEREQLQTTNTQFQHKLAEYFRKKKTDDQRQEMDKNVTDQEQRYLKYMSNLEELRKQEEEETKHLQDQEEDLSYKKDEKLELVEIETNQFAEFKKQTALNAINTRTGKPILPKDVEQYLMNEVKKEDEVKMVRLDNIKLKNRLKKREQQLKAKEELAEGLHLIDFEQLKIENQTYNEKIEERNEELLKLRKKITSTVQVLTHVKEKLQFVQAENQVQKANLRDVEELVAKKRDVLSRTKRARDKLRIDNQRQMQKCGLLGNKPLLRDFEERKDEGDNLRSRLEYLKRQHAELTLDSNGLRRKIEEAKSVHN
ncbi:cilia- and flagella-associated protein 184-like [Antedon mediterranea]|uniref:cilia- and flagella-associated protein 184-like n=1 Tax=Antedon mediterranea TaxID=105859 RepID=UPI003AF614AD